MVLDKELALAIDFKKAPKEVQDAANAHYANVKLLAKAKVKVSQGQSELELATKNYEETAKILRLALKSWEPEV